MDAGQSGQQQRARRGSGRERGADGSEEVAQLARAAQQVGGRAGARDLSAERPRAAGADDAGVLRPGDNVVGATQMVLRPRPAAIARRIGQVEHERAAGQRQDGGARRESAGGITVIASFVS